MKKIIVNRIHIEMINIAFEIKIFSYKNMWNY